MCAAEGNVIYNATSYVEDKCGFNEFKGDGYCDDIANNHFCEFDGGDCCEDEETGQEVNTMFCQDCLCLKGITGMINREECIK